MDTPSIPIPPPEPAAALSEPARIINTFIAPSKTFIDLKRSAAWWGPYVVIAVVTLLFVYVVDQRIGFSKVVDNQIQLSPRAQKQMEQLPSDQRDQALQRQVAGTRIFSYLFFLFILAWYAVVALILWASFKLVVGSEVGYMVSLAIVLYASLPQVIKSALAMVLVYLTGGEGFTFQDPVATNAGFLLSQLEHPFWHSLLVSLDVFMIWTLLLTAFGFAWVSKIRRNTALAVVLTWYLVVVLFGAGLAAAFS